MYLIGIYAKGAPASEVPPYRHAILKQWRLPGLGRIHLAYHAILLTKMEKLLIFTARGVVGETGRTGQINIGQARYFKYLRRLQ